MSLIFFTEKSLLRKKSPLKQKINNDGLGRLVGFGRVSYDWQFSIPAYNRTLFRFESATDFENQIV
jgi:hypothetical protein